MRKHIFARIASLAPALLFMMLAVSSCRTDYSENAVDRAREYVLDNLTGLNESQRNFVRFTQPVIYENMIFPRNVLPLNVNGHIEIDDVRRFPEAPQHDLMHSCIVWSPPDLGAKIVVAGEGERNMMFWNPYRALIKRYDAGNQAFYSAMQAASVFVVSNMLYLTTEEINRARFAEPQVYYTKLDVRPEEQGNPDELTPWEDYLNQKNNPHTYTQISLVWPGNAPDQSIVVTGFSTSGTLSGWKIRTAELMNTSKLDNAKLTTEEIAAIDKKIPVSEMVFPAQEDVIRNPYDSESNPNAPFGGAIIYH